MYIFLFNGHLIGVYYRNKSRLPLWFREMSHLSVTDSQ